MAIEVEATSSVVLPGQKILLTAKVNGKADETVTWHLQEGSAGGSIALSSTYPDAQHTGPQWVYTAPNTGGTYHIVSTARADPEHPVSTALVVQEPVAGCATNSSETGVWKNITPSQVDLTTGDFFGMQAMALDPTDPSTVYVGRAMGGIYKSTDCGASWVKISTGRNAEAMSSGRSWTMVIDPSNPKVIYTNQGYGQSGLFKSTNGGVDWDQILTPNITSVAPYGGFIGAVSIDPDDARHLLVGWHAECPPPHPKVCYAETTDGGDSWKMRDGDASWQGSEGTRFQVLNAKTWIFSSESNGLWRSVDRGASWQRVLGASISHGVGQLYRSKDMEFYFGTANGVMHSADGANWTTLPNSGNLIMGLIGDGKTLYISRAYPSYSPGAAPYRPYFFAAEDPSAEFSAMDSPLMRNGGAELHLDATRHFLYSTNLNAGLWRVKLK
ncbi:WD40/YVTN/BNR-like repeat-containing protein [Hyphomicrobium facile]|uniref:Sortilin N-terminal domain-containing protein n=1 Tax=Hyphomicrobium facile TaxID=51670 RepID=A0A1I7NFD9_9HYPH|nr:hypothetical protein [Hyphomicrobium facile]SFV33381.1 hypothetical protein SAMN04488557_1957 [Hyphomicrobium facile]